MTAIQTNDAISGSERNFLAGGGGMGALMRAHDWSSTDLGDPADWPQSLRTAVRLMLNTGHPMYIWWGKSLACLYNDAYRRSIGPERHPGSLGRPAREVWEEIWPLIGPQIAQVMTGRGATWHENQLVPITRNGKREDVYWTYSYGPIDDESAPNGVGGVLVVCTETTQQVVGAHRLAADRERFTRLFDQAPGFIAMLDGPQHRFELVNPAYLRLIGDRDILGKTVAEALPEVVDQGYVELLDGVFRTGKAFTTTDAKYTLQTAPGGPVSERFLDFVYQPIMDSDGNVTGIFVEGSDMTARKRAETRQAALLELGDRLRDLTDPGDLAFAASEILGRALGVSRVGYGVIDKVAETITIERDWNAPGIESLAGVLHFRDYGSYIEDLKRGDTVVFSDAETDPRTRANAPALKAISAQAAVNMPLLEQGRFVAILYANNAGPHAWGEDDLALMREVADRVHVASERARSEQALRQSEEQFRVFAQAIPNQLWASRPDGFLDWFSDQVYAYCGEAPGTLDGQTEWARILHPDDLAGAGDAWGRSLSTGEIYETEFRIRRFDGVYRWFLVRAEPVHARDGGIVRWVGTNTDIDDRRRQTAELALLNATLEEQVATRTRALMATEETLRQSQKMEAVGQLTGGLAHDFNNLLTGIGGSLEMIQSRIAQGRMDVVDRYVTAGQGAVKRAAALTHRLLAFSRRQTLDPKPTNVNRLVNEMEDLIRRTVGPGVYLEVVGAGGLWPTLVDPNQLENALLNLCINARDAMPDGGRLTIETANKWLDERAAKERELPPGQYVSLCVTDTGTGMTPDVVEKAFDPFFTTKPLGQGTGLGLSMIYGFARQSGGQVRIYSEIGKGTTMCLYLPRHDADAEAEAAVKADATARQIGDGEVVLVVDDEPTVRMLIAEVLEEVGYKAIEASDGPAGMRVLQSPARIDLLITDVGLPGGMNGRQIADAARVLRPGLKVLFITGYAENAVIGNGHLDKGMQIITKPFAMDDLARKIRDIIES